MYLINLIIGKFDWIIVDTILMVFGDHGMTESGDHGGDSNAGMFHDH